MKHQSRVQGYFPASFFRRSDRILINNQGYHYRVRKGDTVGPFAKESDAHINLNKYLKQVAIEEPIR